MSRPGEWEEWLVVHCKGSRELPVGGRQEMESQILAVAVDPKE